LVEEVNEIFRKGREVEQQMWAEFMSRFSSRSMDSATDEKAGPA